MKTVVAEIKGVGAISFSRHHASAALEGESPDALDARTWREKLHYDGGTLEAQIPGIMLKFALDYTAGQLGLKIKGRGNKTWASVFKSGVLCLEPVGLGIKRDEVECITVMCHPQGRRGPGPRVPRRFPIVHQWRGTTSFLILNDSITEEIFRFHLTRAGEFCGLGRYAPRNGGDKGRFAVQDLLWQDHVLEAAE